MLDIYFKLMQIVTFIFAKSLSFVIRTKKARSASTSNDEYVQAELDSLININKLNS